MGTGWGFLTEDEVDRILLCLAVEAGDTGFTEEDAEKILDWAHSVRIGSAMLKLALDGKIGLSFKDGEVAANLLSDERRERVATAIEQ